MVSTIVRSRIRQKREEKGITQKDMAERLHMDERNYARIETGEKKILDVATIEKISKELEIDITELFAAEESINIESMNNCSGNVGGIMNNKEVVFNNNIPDDAKEIYKIAFEELKSVIEEKNKTIALLQSLLDKQK